MEWNYIFHINRNISQNGPLFFNKGRERLFLGFLGNPKEDYAEMVNKLDRILNNYQPIQPFIRGLKRDPKTFVGKISKHPIKNLSNDRTLILGEAGGIVTAFFYEGFLGGLASADIATSVLKPLLETNSNFTHPELKKYDQEVYRILVNKYFKTNLASEYLFYHGGSKQAEHQTMKSRYLTQLAFLYKTLPRQQSSMRKPWRRKLERDSHSRSGGFF